MRGSRRKEKQSKTIKSRFRMGLDRVLSQSEVEDRLDKRLGNKDTLWGLSPNGDGVGLSRPQESQSLVFE